MNILFLHRNFPAQFRHIAPTLANDENNKVFFITNNDKVNIPNINKLIYRPKREVPPDCHQYLRFYEDSIIHAQATADVAINLRKSGFIPDIIYGHTWGQTMYIKDIFPEAKLLCYFEWFYNAKGGDIGFDGRSLSIDELAKLRAKNSHLLVDLYTCDAGICPTNFQKKQFPKEYSDKIKVIHDGVDTDYCIPNDNTIFKVPNTNIEFSKNDEVITYATRGMEAYRGFPEFMKAAEKLLKKRSNLQIVIGGEDRVCYGPQLANTTYKTLMLQQLDLDLSRVHFVGSLSFSNYVKLLQISSAHVYLTYPFVCSWSLLDAMSCATPVVASNTEPVQEFVTDNETGLLFDFYNIDEQMEKIEFALDNKEIMKNIGKNARQHIIDNYSLNNLLPKQINYIHEIIKTLS